MDYLEHLFKETVDPRVVAELRTRLERLRVERTNRMRQAQARVLQLEEDVARVALLSRAVAELCLRKKLFTKLELVEQLVATDIVDGAMDYKLDPALALPGELRTLEKRSKKPKAAPRRKR